MGVQYYPYTVTLNAPAIIRAIGSDPSSAFSLNYIPGSAIRGAVARGIATQNKGLIERVILSGQVKFFNAYPFVKEKRYLPTPKSYMKIKHEPEKEYYNLAVSSYNEKKQLVKVTIPFVTVTRTVNEIYAPEMGRRLHNTRDRTKGRPYGKGSKKKGTMFFNEFIEPNQSFCGIVAVDESDPDLIKAVKGGIGDYLVVGRSKRAGYGGWGKIQWLGPISRETDLTGTSNLAETISPDEDFQVLLLSNYVGRDLVTGYSDPYSIVPILKTKLGDRAEFVRMFATTVLVGGYNRTWGIEIPQAWALSAGSVLVFKAKETISKEDILQIEQEGIGLRRIDGYGRIAFLKMQAYKVPVKELELTVEHKNSGTAPPLVQEMEDRLIKRELRKRCTLVVQNLVDVIKKRTRHPLSNSLIGRLRTPLRAKPDQAIKTLQTWLDTNSSKPLKSEASRSLNRVIFTPFDRNESTNLRLFLLDLVTVPKDSDLEKWFKEFLAPEQSLQSLRLTNRDLWNSVNMQQLILDFLDEFLAALSQLNTEE